MVVKDRRHDFFPYASEPYAYWTGFYPSRAAFKGYVRTRSCVLHTAQQLVSLSGLPAKTDGIETLEKAMAVAQHHDAVSGTEKQHVVDDYALRLSNGTEVHSWKIPMAQQ